MRVSDPTGGPPKLDVFLRNYEDHYRGMDHYAYHLMRLVAGYSRGDGPEALRAAYTVVADRVAANQADAVAKEGPGARALAHRGKFAEPFRDALVLLAFGACLRVEAKDCSRVLEACERGDPLLESLAGAALPGAALPAGKPAFYGVFDRLYDVLAAPEGGRAALIASYLDTWYGSRMAGFSFKDVHLEPDPSDYVGYWCFEAAGVVAALGVDDRSLRTHPQYPADLAAFFGDQG